MMYTAVSHYNIYSSVTLWYILQCHIMTYTAHIIIYTAHTMIFCSVTLWYILHTLWYILHTLWNMLHTSHIMIYTAHTVTLWYTTDVSYPMITSIDRSYWNEIKLKRQCLTIFTLHLIYGYDSCDKPLRSEWRTQHSGTVREHYATARGSPNVHRLIMQPKDGEEGLPFVAHLHTSPASTHS
jgi:hypothetical protein